MAINSKIIVCSGINLDRDYLNVINYTEANMINLCESKKVDSRNNYSFVGKENIVSTDFDYNKLLQCNYMAFQNTRYANKWFFAWIDKIEYINNGTTRIYFTVDEWSTWYDYWDKKPCFTVREHVATDTVGLNTVPEDIDVGRVKVIDAGSLAGFSNFYVGIFTNYDVNEDHVMISNPVYNNLMFAQGLLLFDSYLDVTAFIDILNNSTNATIDDIADIIIVPTSAITITDLYSRTFDYPSYEGDDRYKFYELLSSTTPTIATHYVTKKHAVTGYYQAKNNKCYVYPYNYLEVSNNVGNSIIYKYEEFADSQCNFEAETVISIGGSSRLIPKNYEGLVRNYRNQIVLGKYPTLSWSADSFVNWLTQNAINVEEKVVSDVMSIGKNTVTGNVEGLLKSITDKYYDYIGTFKKAELLPDKSYGSNIGDVNFSAGTNTYVFRCMRCEDEYMKIIDDYFTKFGYKVNRLKIPEFSSRTYWNFVQIGDSEVIGVPHKTVLLEEKFTPTESWEKINKILRRGVTIWHSHDNIGRYDLTNSIITT